MATKGLKLKGKGLFGAQTKKAIWWAEDWSVLVKTASLARDWSSLPSPQIRNQNRNVKAS
jgi:hypothetical protein